MIEEPRPDTDGRCREMHQLKVYRTVDGDIAIEQDDPALDESHLVPARVVLVRPEQADLLIQWIREMQTEIQAAPARSDAARG